MRKGALTIFRLTILPILAMSLSLGFARTGNAQEHVLEPSNRDFYSLSPQERREKLDTAYQWAKTVAQGDSIRYERELQNALGNVTGQYPRSAAMQFSPRLRLYYELVPYNDGFGARLTQPPLRDSPVNPIGLEPGDMIIQLDERPILAPAELENHYAETSVTFINIRTGQPGVGRIILPWFSPPKPSGFLLGITTTAARARHYPVGVPVTSKTAMVNSLGVRVVEVIPGSPAALAGLRVDDVILTAGPRAVTDNNALHQSVVESTGNLPMTIAAPNGIVRTLVVDFRIAPKGK